MMKWQNTDYPSLPKEKYATTYTDTIDISKSPTIHAPSAIKQSIPCEHYMFGHLSHDKLKSITPNINKFLTKQCYTCAQTKMKKKPIKS
eukprot:Pgem_evm1s6267